MVKLTANQLKVEANDSVIIEGVLQFSAIVKPTTSFTRNSQFGEKEQYGVTISNPTFTGKENLVKFLEQSVYDSEKYGDKRLTVASAGLAPRVHDTVVRRPSGIKLSGELAAGQNVKVQVAAFKPENYANIGISLRAVLIEDENNIQYYQQGNALAAFGLEANFEAGEQAGVAPESFEKQMDANPVDTTGETPFSTSGEAVADPFATQPDDVKSNPFD